MKNFKDSSTIQGAIAAEKKISNLPVLGTAAVIGVPVLLNEIGIGGDGARVITDVVTGVANGEEVQSALINGGIKLGLAALVGVIAKKDSKKVSKQIVDGRLKANEAIEPESIPQKYQNSVK